jgi:outer membrane lipoprotein SlyB
MNKLSFLIPISICTFLITACAQNISPNSYDVAEAGVASKVVHGTIIGKRKVKIDANTGAGGLAGAAAGAAGGSAVGGGDRGHIVGAIGGAVLGGVIGNAVEKRINSHQAYEYIIKLNNDRTISIAQTQELEFNIHQPVLVIYGATTRIVPDDTVELQKPLRSEPKRAKKRSEKRQDMNHEV